MGPHHLHQIVGGNSLKATMGARPRRAVDLHHLHRPVDFSNYCTAVMYFRARNKTYKRVNQLGILFFEYAREGGMKIYCFQPRKNTTKVLAFKKRFRMGNGNPNARKTTSASRYQGIDYTCLLRDDTRYANRSTAFPSHMPDHYSHVSWPVGTTFAPGSPRGDYECPVAHPVVIPQVVLEIRWDTRESNSAELWPEDGSQPFVWTFGDRTGYGHRGDYIIGRRDDSLRRAFDSPSPGQNCDDRHCGVTTQTMSEANKCMIKPSVSEAVDEWLDIRSGEVVADS
ncbi:hypothetical protein VTK56DRAFT_1148 [Thermocarpiscus australiensis]